jgi:hypothetical protein
MMLQFRVEWDRKHGNMWIYCTDTPHKGMLLERAVCLKQRNNSGEYV